jgi:hypothetical protein
LYPVNLATAFPMHRKACRKACTSTTQNIIKDCRIRFAEAATVACRFSRARTLTALAPLFKALFQQKTNMLFSNLTDNRTSPERR